MTLKTLLIDGDNLFKIAYHGAKDLHYNGKHIGGIYHFIYIIKKFLDEHNHDKVIVFWDADSNISIRKKMYPKYKDNRKKSVSKIDDESVSFQKNRIKQYLEEVFIRQVECEGNEADDLISYYCKISTNEDIIIFSADKDLTQLISERIKVYSPINKTYYKYNDKIPINKTYFHHKNVILCKVLVGDSSDNIAGIKGLGEKTLVDIIPEIQNKEVTLNDVFNKVKTLTETKNSKVLSNILTGTNKYGMFGDDFYTMNESIIDLSKLLLTDDAIKIVSNAYSDVLDPQDRDYKNLMKMMIEDGIFKYLPKQDNNWVDFIKPFIKLTRKEKKRI